MWFCSFSFITSIHFSKLFALEEGGKGGYPKEHTLVCDLGNRVQPTHLSRKERRKISWQQQSFSYPSYTLLISYRQSQ